jgi:anti-sigma B factor antagonist
MNHWKMTLRRGKSCELATPAAFCKVAIHAKELRGEAWRKPANGPRRQLMNIKVQIQGETLNVGGVKELSAANANAFRDQVRGSLADRLKNIEIDLSQTMFLDSCGLGALISLHKTACTRSGAVRLLNPTPPVQQILELTRLHRVFEIVKK